MGKYLSKKDKETIYAFASMQAFLDKKIKVFEKIDRPMEQIKYSKSD